MQGPQTRINSQAQDEDIKDPRYPYVTGISPPESTLQTRVHTEEPGLDNPNKYYSERIIIENKNKLLVCVDNDNPNEPLKYCFVAKTGEVRNNTMKTLRFERATREDGSKI